VVNLIPVTALLLTSCLHCCKQRIFSKNTSYAVVVFWIKLVTFCKS